VILKRRTLRKVEGKIVGTKSIIKNIKNHVGIPFMETEIEIDKYGIVRDRRPDTKPRHI